MCAHHSDLDCHTETEKLIWLALLLVPNLYVQFLALGTWQACI